MPQLSINLTSEQHKKLKEIADSKGLTIEEYVLDRTFYQQNSHSDEEEVDYQHFKSFLLNRIKDVENGEISDKTIEQIKQEARAKYIV